MRGRDPWPRFMAPVHCSLFDFLFVFMGAYGWLARGSINARDGQDTERALVCVGERSHGDDKRERERERKTERVSLRTQTISILPLIPRAESLEREMAVNRSATNRGGPRVNLRNRLWGKGFPTR